MNFGDGINPSPLLSNDEANLQSSAIEQDAVSALTLTDFQTIDLPSWRHPILSTNAYLSRLSSVFSSRYLSFLAIDNFALSGGVMSLLWSVSLPLFKELGISASRQQLYTTMIISPFALKPFIGVASDLFPIRGYNKRYIALFSIFLGLFGCSMLLVLYHTGSASAAVSQGPASVQRLADLIVVCCFAMNLEVATLEIMAEGKYSELMRLHPESGSSIITFKFVWSVAGMILTQTYVGPLSDKGYFHVIFWIALVLLSSPFFPTLWGWIPEKKRRIEEQGMAKAGCCGILFDRGLFQKKKTPFIAIAMSGLAAPLMSAVSTYANLGIGLVCLCFVLLALVATTYAVFPFTVFRITLGMMLLMLCRIRLTSGLSYFYTANSKCLPDGKKFICFTNFITVLHQYNIHRPFVLGPQFSYTFYITLTGIIGSVIHLIAVMLYQTYMSSWKFRPALMFTIGIGSLATIVDLIIVMRWNVAVGVPDKVFFLLGNATFENLTNILHAIPMSAISAKIAPPGMESAVFAYSVGIGTFCFMVSNLLGSVIIEWSGMKTVGEDCNFDNLPYLIVVFQILVPLLVGLPSTLFIPNVLQTEQLIDWKKEKWYEDETTDPDQTFDSDQEAINDEVPGSQDEPLL
ncbi:hypothetical protein ACHAXR_007360 [Thalassiosira sp. AJA248-18]